MIVVIVNLPLITEAYLSENHLIVWTINSLLMHIPVLNFSLLNGIFFKLSNMVKSQSSSLLSAGFVFCCPRKVSKHNMWLIWLNSVSEHFYNNATFHSVNFFLWERVCLLAISKSFKNLHSFNIDLCMYNIIKVHHHHRIVRNTFIYWPGETPVNLLYILTRAVDVFYDEIFECTSSYVNIWRHAYRSMFSSTTLSSKVYDLKWILIHDSSFLLYMSTELNNMLLCKVTHRHHQLNPTSNLYHINQSDYKIKFFVSHHIYTTCKIRFNLN